MAPPTPILSRAEAISLIPREGKGKCTLHSLTQHNCSFEGGLVTCVPFKRLFKDCVLRSGKHRVVEITDTLTNLDSKLRAVSGSDGCEMNGFKAAQIWRIDETRTK